MKVLVADGIDAAAVARLRESGHETIERTGLKAGPFARWMLRGRRRKHWMRTLYGLRSLWQLKRASLDETGRHDYWQAGNSVEGIGSIEPAGSIVRRFASPDRSLPRRATRRSSPRCWRWMRN